MANGLDETLGEVELAPTLPLLEGAAGLSRLPAFTTAELVAERYSIVRFVAKGGMGEVYEAADRELQCRVALKPIRSDLANDELAVARFRREIHLARRVTHPNVCRIFDVGHHRLPSRSAVTFLT